MFGIEISDKGRVSITGSLTVASVGRLYEELENVFNNSSCTVLDCTGVTEIDTAALQVLIAFRRAILELNSSMEFILSPAMDESISLLGLGYLFKAA